MKTLFVNGCIRPNSRTLRIARHLVDNYFKDAEEVDLSDVNITPLNKNNFAYRGKLIGENKINDEAFNLLNQFKEAETVIIACPYYNLHLPSNIKAYFDDVITAELTFGYDEKGAPISYSKVKKVIFITTAGGVVIEDNAFEFIKLMFSVFFQVTDFTQYKAENLDVVGVDVEQIIRDTLNKIDQDYQA